MHGTDGKKFDRVSGTWLPAAEYDALKAFREERAYQRKPRQGEVCAPMVISDAQGGVRGIQSMGDGKFYDSKSEMRKHYRRDGFAEVGNDSSLTSGRRVAGPSHAEKEARTRKIREHIGRAFAQVSEKTPGGWKL